MLRSKKVRAAVERKKVRTSRTSSPQRHWVDVWLPRLSHLAQFGLFLFTLVFSYFTVLPLYQKAVLEEAVAKKEVELAALNKSLASSYAKVRVYAMREFYIEAMPACGGLFIERTRGGDETATKMRAKMVFQIDVPTCLKDLSNRVEALQELAPRDRQTFDSALSRISHEVAEKKQQLIVDYESVASRVTDADWATLPPDSFRVQMQIFLEKLRGGDPDLPARRRIAEALAKERVGTAYEDLIRDRVVSLRKIKWN